MRPLQILLGKGILLVETKRQEDGEKREGRNALCHAHLASNCSWLCNGIFGYKATRIVIYASMGR